MRNVYTQAPGEPSEAKSSRQSDDHSPNDLYYIRPDPLFTIHVILFIFDKQENHVSD
ncbi:hypothetical protein D3C75_1350310 [compost metagenome]